MTHVYVNNAETTLAVGLNTGEEAMTVANASMLPSLSEGAGGIALTLTHSSFPGLFEVVLVTDVSGAPELLVTRGYEGDQQDWPIGTHVRGNITARMLGAMLQQDDETKVVRMPSGNAVLLGSVKASSTTAFSGSFVGNGKSRMASAVQISGFPILQLAATDGNDLDRNFSNMHIGGTPPMELGMVPTWADGQYRRGSVVAPTTPTGYQYWLEINDINTDYLSLAGEPAFSGENPVDVDGGTFWAIETPADFSTGNVQGLVVTEVGFICQRYGGSAPPSVSIGTASAPTRYANAQSMTSITASNTIHRFPIAVGGPIVHFEALRFQVTTPAAGGRCLGRFYWHGFFVELDDAL